MKVLTPLFILAALPVLAQDAPLPTAAPVAAPPAAQAAPVPQAASAFMIPVLDGDSQVTLSQGSFDSGKTHASAATYLPIVGFFAGSAKKSISVVGEYSESKAPGSLKRILLTGYSPKALGMYGTILLCKAKVDGGNRVLKTSDGQVDKNFWKTQTDVAKLTQSSDGAWFFDVKKPLEAGHYVITFLKVPAAYWDFDVM